MPRPGDSFFRHAVRDTAQLRAEIVDSSRQIGRILHVMPLTVPYLPANPHDPVACGETGLKRCKVKSSREGAHAPPHRLYICLFK